MGVLLLLSHPATAIDCNVSLTTFVTDPSSYVLFLNSFEFNRKCRMKVAGTQNVDPFLGEREGKQREVGGQAVWSLSSCKPGRAGWVKI